MAQYQAFVDAGGYGDPKKDKPNWWTKAGWNWRVKESISGPENYDPVFQTPNHPRVGVSWFEAAAFCGWLTERLCDRNSRREEALTSGKDGASLPRLLPGGEIRLPSEGEWERAARGTDGRAYPWGEDGPTGDHCNWGKSGIGHTSAVGLFPKGHAECGAADLAGNVREWCRTKWLDRYKGYEKKVSKDPEGEDPCVLRGGSWINDGPGSLSCASRYDFTPGIRVSNAAFRCVLVVGGSASG